MKVYFDNAATTALDPEVIACMTEVMQNDFGNPSSIHSAGRKARTLIEKARKDVAEILRASVGEVFFTSCATESNNMAISCSVRDLGVTRIISSPTEHPCVINTLKCVAQCNPNISVIQLNVDSTGNIDMDQLATLLSDTSEKTLVSVMHGNNEIGTMIDIDAVAQLCQQAGALFHCDTVQTIGKFDIDLSKTKINFLSGSGHKIYGPKGIGIIYINNDTQINAMINGGGQERKMRSGTENTYGIVGFAKALQLVYENRDSINAKSLELRNYFKERAAEVIGDVRYNGNQEERFLPHILSVSLPMTDKTDLIMFNMDIAGICASAGSACSSGSEKGSHVMEAIGAPSDRKTIRISFSHHNTKEEIDYAVEKLAGMI